MSSGGFSFGSGDSGGINFGGSSGTSGTSGGFSFGSGSTSGSSGTSGFNFGSGSTSGTGSSGTSGGFGFGGSGTSGGSSGSSGFNFGSSGSGTSGGSGFNFGGSGTSSGGSGFNFGGSSSGTSFGSSGSTGLSFGSSGGFGSSFESTGSFQQNPIVDAIQKIANFYDSNHPSCRFNYFFYNISPNLVTFEQIQQIAHYYQKIIPPLKWHEAMKKSPNPQKFYPVPARSFHDLSLRGEEQQKRVKRMIEKLKEYEKKLNKIKQTHNETTLKTIENIKSKNMNLNGRVLTLQKKIEVLMQKGTGIGDVDNKIKNKLEIIQQDLHQPNQFRGRLNELIPQLNYFLEKNQNYQLSLDSYDKEAIENIQLFLNHQSEGLKYLINIVKKDTKDMNIITKTEQKNH